jgi:hypothetical protein
VRVEAYPVAAGLDGDNDAGGERFARQGFEVDRESPLTAKPGTVNERLRPTQPSLKDSRRIIPGKIKKGGHP